MKQVLTATAMFMLLFSCKKDTTDRKESSLRLVAEYRTVSYTRKYVMHPKSGTQETADKPFSKGYGLIQFFTRGVADSISSAFVVMIDKDGGVCGQDTVAVKSVEPGIFELLDSKIGSCALSSRTYIRISPVNEQQQDVSVGANARISYDGPSAGIVDWIYYDYQTVIRVK